MEKYQVKLTNIEAFTNTFKALVGIGILSCPSSFKDVGLLGGIIGTIIIVLFNILINTQLIKVIAKVSSGDKKTLGDITGKILGRGYKYAVEIVIACC